MAVGHLIITIILAIVTIYLLVVNRKLSKMKIDEELEQLEIKEEEIKRQNQKKIKNHNVNLSRRGWNPKTSSSASEFETELKTDEEIELKKIEVRRKYLNKRKKFRGLWSKID